MSETSTWSDLVFFSSASDTAWRFFGKLGPQAGRIPLRRGGPALVAQRPFVLITQTYGGGNGRGAVPKQVITFLNDQRNRDLIRGVIGAGNTIFGAAYCLAGDVISSKCRVPHLYRVDLLGTPRDVATVRTGLDRFWTEHPANEHEGAAA
ncbi:class Ib ribonucleoside-diphosphate reductase assembly flavoprotein NrdI [Brachybacterium sacelli]